MSKFEVFVVGGAVRDVLSNRLPKDLDYVVVGATEQDMLNRGFSKVGADFPVFLHPESNDEYALARTERKVAAGYNGFEVDFDPSVTLEQDLVRRDLTINAMAVRSDDWDRFVLTRDWGLVIDPFSGRHDLGNKILRHVSNAFSEDPVRVLRVARFAARYDFDINIETQNLMCALTQSGELDHLVPERVWTEMEKAMGEVHPSSFFWALKDCGALEVLMPEFEFTGDISEHLHRGVFLPVPQRFATLFILTDVADIETVLDRLKAPTEVRTAAVRTRRMFELVTGELTPEKVVDTLERTVAFGNSDDTWKSLQVCELSNWHCVENIYFLRSTLSALQAVCFASLSYAQQSRLTGPAVGRALREMRLNIVNEQLRSSNS